MAQSSTLCISMDVHTEAIAVADVAQDHGAEVTSLRTIGPRQWDSDQRIRQTVKYEDYKQFKADVKVTFGDTVDDKKDQKQDEKQKKP